MEKDGVRDIIKKMTLEEKARFAVSARGMQVFGARDGEKIKIPPPRYDALLCLGCSFDAALATQFGRVMSSLARDNGDAFTRLNCGVAREPMREGSERFLGEDAMAVAQMCQAIAAGATCRVMAEGILGGENDFCERYMDARAENELYLYPFYQVAKNCGAVEVPAGCINGELCGESEVFLKKLEDNIPPDTLIVNACGSVYSANCGGVNLIQAEADIENFYELARDGKVPESLIDKKLERVFLCAARVKGAQAARVTPEDIENFCYKLSCESVVLLKNEGVLPLLNKTGVSIFGDISKEESALLASELLPHYKKAVDDIRIVFLRLEGEKYTSEQVEIVKSLKGKNTKVVAVLIAPRPAPLPFLAFCDSVFFCPYYGEKTIEGLRKMFVGKVNPSGKLSVTYAKTPGDYPACGNSFLANRGMFCYESVMNGYRYFDVFSADVLYPFGHGLSYTKFEIITPKISCDKKNLTVDFVVKNVGDSAGVAVVFIFGSIFNDEVFGLQSRLVTSERVFLKAGEQISSHKVVNLNAFSVFDEKKNEWKTVGGKYEISIRMSSRDTRFCGNIKVAGVKRLSKEFTSKTAPSYYDKTAFSPLGVDIEKLMKTPLIALESEFSKYLKMASGVPRERLVKAVAKKLSRGGEMTHMQASLLASRLSLYALKKILDSDKI